MFRKKITVSKMIVNTFPEEIVCDDGVIDFDVTVANFAERIMEDVDEPHMKSYFGTIFQTAEDCENFIKLKLINLYEDCYNYIQNRNEDEEDD